MSLTEQTGNPPSLTYPSGAEVVLAPDADREAWHAIRRTGLGGSDIAAICGLSPYTSPLEIWLSKVGQPVPRAVNPTLDEAAEMGHELEPIVARRFTKNTGLPAWEGPGTLRRPDVPWMLGNLDRATEQNGELGVLELKTRSSYALNDWLEQAPVDVEIQGQWYMAVTGWQFAWIAVLIGGQRTLTHRIERDEQMISDLIGIGADFWDQVQNRVRPAIDGSVATGALLDRLHANSTDAVLVADAADVEQWLKQRAHAKEQIAGADMALTEAENHLKDIAGNYTDIHIRGELAYSWRPKRGQVSWKAAALAADPDLDPESYRGQPSRTLRIHLENL